MITQERMEQAMDYLAQTDAEIAEAKADVRRQEYLLKRKEAHAFLAAEGAVKERESKAKTDAEVTAASDAVIDALTLYEKLAAKRERAALVIEVWRTLESSRRAGL